MDRISALRNVENALRAFEDGEADLATTEQRVNTVLQTFATEFEMAEKRAYTTVDEHETATETVVVASSPAAARERVAVLTNRDPGDVEVTLLK